MKRIIAYSIVGLIVLFAFFKYWILSLFSIVVSSVLTSMGGDPLTVLDFLNQNSNYTVYQDHYLGWFIYYPLFFGMHFLFIFLHFSGKTRRIIFKVVVGVILLLLLLIALGKILHIPFLFEISFLMFQNLFALPFLLLVLEGGRILLNDINRKLEDVG